ncbi:MAG TPA: hypothetical protein VG325_19730 [Solirubrobacteraceae bacterium]|nr:hypothetical protein [Solirubrobacteraceae bacterium]
MTQHQTSRTLVKSAPELWAECSDAASLARHLGAFGEIRITKLQPETAVAWEGAAASGTVTLEPSGWGTRVTLTVTEAQTTGTDGAGAETAEPVADLAEPQDRVDDADESTAGAVEVAPSAEAEPVPMPPAEPEPVPMPPAEPASEPGRQGVLARLRLRLRRRAPDSSADAETPPPFGQEPPAGELAPAGPPEPLIGESTGGDTTASATTASETSRLRSPDQRDERRGENVLAAALESLGRAHHRPYSRA